jgi:hypothetical protein
LQGLCKIRKTNPAVGSAFQHIIFVTSSLVGMHVLLYVFWIDEHHTTTLVYSFFPQHSSEWYLINQCLTEELIILSSMFAIMCVFAVMHQITDFFYVYYQHWLTTKLFLFNRRAVWVASPHVIWWQRPRVIWWWRQQPGSLFLQQCQQLQWQFAVFNTW